MIRLDMWHQRRSPNGWQVTPLTEWRTTCGREVNGISRVLMRFVLSVLRKLRMPWPKLALWLPQTATPFSTTFTPTRCPALTSSGRSGQRAREVGRERKEHD